MFDFLKKKISGFFKKEEESLEKIAERPVSVEEKKELEPRLTLGTKLKKAIVRKAVIKEEDIHSLLGEFTLSLLEADVAVSVAEKISEDIKKRLVGKEISGKDDVKAISEQAIKDSLRDVLKQEKIDLLARASEKKPFVIMFLGPNGHGKTSTIGKVAKYLQKNSLSSVIAAADTFRAASIEQVEKIAGRVGVKVIKQNYGSDPAAVCFDAIKYAEAHKVDVVLIDTAGRSELNVNLMEQMKKIVRVAKPDMKIYISEALAGNAALEEAKKFNEAIGLDGIIMTKVDCDVKGGSLLSVSYVTQKPVLFITTGQELDNIMPFDENWFIEKVI
jgi:fused signal recognition particle receptor